MLRAHLAEMIAERLHEARGPPRSQSPGEAHANAPRVLSALALLDPGLAALSALVFLPVWSPSSLGLGLRHRAAPYLRAPSRARQAGRPSAAAACSCASARARTLYRVEQGISAQRRRARRVLQEGFRYHCEEPIHRDAVLHTLEALSTVEPPHHRQELQTDMH